MTAPNFGGGGLAASGAVAGGLGGLSKAMEMLMQLKFAQRQMDFQREQSTRTGLMQHGIFLPENQNAGQAMDAPAAPQATLPSPANLQGGPQLPPPPTPDVSIGGQAPTNLGPLKTLTPPDLSNDGPLHSPVSDSAMQTRILSGNPNLGQQISQAQGQFQLDPKRPGYGSAVPLSGGGFVMPSAAIAGPEAAYSRALLEANTRAGIAQMPYTQGPTPEQQQINALKQAQIDSAHELAQARMELTQAISDRNYNLRDFTAEDRRYNKVIDEYKDAMKSPNTAMAAYQRVIGELNSGSALNSKTATGALSQLAVPENAKEASQINATLNQMTGKIFGGPFTSWENFQTLIDKIITAHGSTLPDDAKVEIQKAADALIVFQRKKRIMAQERANRHAQRKHLRNWDPSDLEGQTEHDLWEGNGSTPEAPAVTDPNAPAAPGTVTPPASVKPIGKHDAFLTPAGATNE